MLSSLIWVSATVIGTFVFWRRLRGEVDEDDLWKLMFKIVLGSLLASRIAWWLWQLTDPTWQLNWLWQRNWLTGWDILASLTGGVLVAFWVRPQKLRSWGELADSFGEAYGWGAAILIFGYLSVAGRGWLTTWWLPLILTLTLVIWYWARANYRSWTWYPSGKLGFLWWLGLGLIASDQLIINGIQGQLSWQQMIYNTIAVLTSLGGIYKLSGREMREDVNNAQKQLRLVFIGLKQKLRRKKLG